MNSDAPPSFASALSPATDPEPSTAPVLLAEIDQSCRAPVLALFVCGLAWLLAGTVLAVLASLKMHWPEFLADVPKE